MKHITDILITSIAPVIWGSTYLVTTELLPAGYPLTASLLRALPAGLILLALSRQLPTGRWWIKVFILGALNFSVFWWLLFVAAYRLPGGLAATVTSIQPLIVLMLAKLILSNSIKPASVVAAMMGMTGVAIVILTPQAEVDAIGVVAALGSALVNGGWHSFEPFVATPCFSDHLYRLAIDRWRHSPAADRALV